MASTNNHLVVQLAVGAWIEVSAFELSAKSIERIKSGRSVCDEILDAKNCYPDQIPSCLPFRDWLATSNTPGGLISYLRRLKRQGLKVSPSVKKQKPRVWVIPVNFECSAAPEFVSTKTLSAMVGLMAARRLVKEGNQARKKLDAIQRKFGGKSARANRRFLVIRADFNKSVAIEARADSSMTIGQGMDLIFFAVMNPLTGLVGKSAGPSPLADVFTLHPAAILVDGQSVDLMLHEGRSVGVEFSAFESDPSGCGEWLDLPAG